MAYSEVNWAYKDPLTVQKLDQMEDNAVWTSEQRIFGCGMDITGTSVVTIQAGKMEFGGKWLWRNDTVTAIDAEVAGDWASGVSSETSSTSWYVVAYNDSANSFNVKFRASGPAYSDTNSATAMFPRLYDKSGTTWYRYIGRVWNDGDNSINSEMSQGLRPYAIVNQSMNRTNAYLTGTTTIPWTSSTAITNANGWEALTVDHKPMSHTNKLVVDTTLFVSHAIGGAGTEYRVNGFLFKDNVVDALYCVGMKRVANTSFDVMTSRYIITAGTAGTITFKVRIGSETVGTTCLNGQGTGNGIMYGQSLYSSITVTEVEN